MEQNQFQPQSQISLPNATIVLVFGILSIVGCCCYGIVGLICGVIALILANSSKKLYDSNPQAYTQGSYQNVNAGKICAIIGIILSLLVIVYFAWFIATVGVDALQNPELMQERIQELFGQ